MCFRCAVYHFPGVADPLLRNTSRRRFFLDTCMLRRLTSDYTMAKTAMSKQRGSTAYPLACFLWFIALCKDIQSIVDQEKDQHDPCDY